MRRCTRGPVPRALARWGAELTADFVSRRSANRKAPFRWPQRDGVDLFEEVCAALSQMTDGHCSYCDARRLDATGVRSIDHFRPKSEPEFYALAYEWRNLFLTCFACNSAKGKKWHEQLLAPDEADYDFERYFEYHPDTGKLHPNPMASPVEQARARRTIEIFRLNRAGACDARIEAATAMQERVDVDALPYRFLRALFGPEREE